MDRQKTKAFTNSNAAFKRALVEGSGNMSRWMFLLLAASALSLVISEDKADEEKDDDEEPPSEPPAEGGNKKILDGMSEEERQSMMEKMQNIHLYHDAFLGDHVKGFRDLKTEERKAKLQELVKNEIDTDKDDGVSVDELREHFRRVSLMYRKRETEDTLKDQDEDKDGKISWEEYDKHSFAGDGGEEQKEMRDQDEKKFKFADVDGDKRLDLQEYHAFNHPGDDKRLTNYVINEQLKKHDTDKDGIISYDEFIKSFSDADDEAFKEELKKDFDENYDKDKDGKLNRDEVQSWAIPEDIFVNEEPPKLVAEADDDKNEKLSAAEIHKHINIFMDKPVEEGQSEEQETGSDNASDAQPESEKGGKHDEL